MAVAVSQDAPPCASLVVSSYNGRELHMGSATLGPGLTDFTRHRLIRNGIWMIAKDYPPATLVRHAPRILCVQIAQLVVAVQHRRVGVWARAIRARIGGRPALLCDRPIGHEPRRRPRPQTDRRGALTA